MLYLLLFGTCYACNLIDSYLTEEETGALFKYIK